VKCMHVLCTPTSPTRSTTALIAYIRGNGIHIANVGDSRAVAAMRDGRVRRVTRDHKVRVVRAVCALCTHTYNCTFYHTRTHRPTMRSRWRRCARVAASWHADGALCDRVSGCALYLHIYMCVCVCAEHTLTIVFAHPHPPPPPPPV
jgi:hypothetical protein